MTPIFYIKDGNLSFADKTVLSSLDLYVYPGDKICLVGRNGSGKSSLMKVIAGEYELDSGELFKNPVTDIGYLKQDVITETNYSIYEFVLEGVKKPEENNKNNQNTNHQNIQNNKKQEYNKIPNKQNLSDLKSALQSVLKNNSTVIIKDENKVNSPVVTKSQEDKKEEIKTEVRIEKQQMNNNQNHSESKNPKEIPESELKKVLGIN